MNVNHKFTFLGFHSQVHSEDVDKLKRKRERNEYGGGGEGSTKKKRKLNTV
jgi:hypothetical protein